jgi:hypothetical protein
VTLNDQTTPTPAGTPPDQILDTVEQVRADLARLRAQGQLPHLPDGELDRQFSGVVEAVDAGLVDEPPLVAAELHGLAALDTWRPSGGGIRARLTRPVVHLLSRLVGAVVRRQVADFSARTAALVDQLAQRQNRMRTFLVRAHLDRIRGLEYRVAELERRLDGTDGTER